jgi:hypothetical protein
MDSSARHTNENSSIYVHSNDPKVVNRGVNIESLRHYEGGILPFISDTPYEKRKINNTNVNYTNKTDHGSRPMHQTTFLVDQHPSHNTRTEYKTHNQKVSAYNSSQLIKLNFCSIKGLSRLTVKLRFGNTINCNESM